MSKYIGMFIDSNLKWNDHINNMTTNPAQLASSDP